MTVPYWLRLARSGATFTAFCSSNGVNWVTVGSSNLTGFATSAVWGLAVTAHNNSLASAVNFDNVALPNTAPVLNVITNRTLIAGQILTVTNTATDANVPPQALTFGLLTSPAGMTLNATNGILTWRPAIAQSPTTNTVAVIVADNGTPSLRATQQFAVYVLRPAVPSLTAPVFSNGVFSVKTAGDSGPDYVLLAATNLTPPVAWLPLKTNLAATLPFNFSDPSNQSPAKFYRVQLAP